MATVEMYTTELCPYCIMAKNLLGKKKVSYLEMNVDADDEKRTEAVKRSGGRLTVPQIFIDGHHIGGYNELNELEKGGELDALLGYKSND